MGGFLEKKPGVREIGRRSSFRSSRVAAAGRSLAENGSYSFLRLSVTTAAESFRMAELLGETETGQLVQFRLGLE